MSEGILEKWDPQRRWSLHGALVLEREAPELAVAVYPNLLDARETLSMRTLLPIVDSDAWLSFLDTLGRRRRSSSLELRLPAVAQGLPLPAPRALAGEVSDLARRRLALLKSKRHDSFSLPGFVFALEDLFLVAKELLVLESALPGTLVPGFARLLGALVELGSEVAEFLDRGEVVALSAWERQALAGFQQRLFLEVPSLAEYRARVSEAVAPDSENVANFAADRCWHWTRRLREQNEACSLHRASMAPARAWGIVVAKLVMSVREGGGPPRANPSEGESASGEADRVPAADASGAGFRDFVSAFLESRPLTPVVAVTCEPAGEVMRVAPAALEPAAHEKRSSRKGWEPSREEIVPFPDLLAPSGGDPAMWASGEERYPGGRFWMGLDLLRLAAEFPHVFLNPTMLSSGAVQLSGEAFTAFHDELRSRGVAQKNSFALLCAPFARIQKQLASRLSVAPLLARPFHAWSKSRQWWDRDATPGKTQGQNALEVLWMDAREHPTLGMGVSWELVEGADEEPLFTARAWIAVNDDELTWEEWTAAKKQAGGYRLPNGVLVPASEYAAHGERFRVRREALERLGLVRLADVWRHHVSQGILREKMSLEEYLASIDLRLSPLLEERRKRHLEKARAEVRALSELQGVLRPYQEQGVAILAARLRLGLNLCLADEMGLGKTLQAIALLLWMRGEKGRLRALIVVPKSVLPNWKRECARFAPSLRVAQWGEGEGEVVLATYARLRLSTEAMASEHWDALLLDEAHVIKNGNTKIAAAVRRISAGWRLALTGTPVENRASELWNLMDWLNPGYLGRREDFSRFVMEVRGRAENRLLLKPLRAALEPVLVRRLKSDPEVAVSLPDKIFEEHFYELSPEQTHLYEDVLAASREAEGSPVARALLLKALLHLRQICDHPSLFWGQGGGLLRRDRSGKVDLFLDLMERLRESSAGVVVFTQFVAMGRLLAEILSAADEVCWGEVPFLQGALSAEERQEMVDAFQAQCRSRALRGEGYAPVIIVSLRAGGLGINLTSADTVVHFDRWWNPAVEDQATDRLHRIGQQRTVTVHHLTGENTLEESLARFMTEKRMLARDLLGGAGEIAGMLQDRGRFLDWADPAGRFRRGS